MNEKAIEAVLCEWLWAKKRVTGEGRDSTEYFDVMGIPEAAQRISALLRLREPDGWQLAPNDPDEAMVHAAADYHANGNWNVSDASIFGGIYCAMLAAKPLPPLPVAEPIVAEERQCSMCNIKTKPPVCKVPGCPIDGAAIRI